MKEVAREFALIARWKEAASRRCNIGLGQELGDHDRRRLRRVGGREYELNFAGDRLRIGRVELNIRSAVL